MAFFDIINLTSSSYSSSSYSPLSCEDDAEEEEEDDSLESSYSCDESTLLKVIGLADVSGGSGGDVVDVLAFIKFFQLKSLSVFSCATVKVVALGGGLVELERISFSSKRDEFLSLSSVT